MTLAGILSGLGPLPAAAQEPDGIDADTYQSLVETVNGRREVLVFTGQGKQVVEKPHATPAGLAYGLYGTPDLIPWSDVTKLEVRKSSAETGALVGAIVGGGGGLALGAAASQPCSGYMDLICGASAGDVVVLTFMGAMAGALVGTGIGALAQTWRPVYERSEGVPVFGLSTLSGGGTALTASLSF